MNDMNNKNIIRVLHYIGSLDFGGSQAFVMELYRNIDRDKVQFDFVTFPNVQGPLYNEILSLRGRIFECPKYNGLNHLKFAEWWDDFLNDHLEYKVIHGHVRSVASIYLPIVRKHRRFAILHSHSASNGKGMSGIIKYFLQLPVRYQADYYMACSEEAGKWLFGNRVIHSNRYRTVPNAIDTDRFVYDAKERASIRQKYGMEDCFCIGHVGRFSEVKNHEFLLEILREVLESYNNVRLLLVGDGPIRAEIQKKVDNMGLSNYVIFAGARSDTEKYYQAMDVFVFPSLWEGFGIAVIEAQISGLHCIVSERVPEAVDVGAGLVTRLNISNSREWAIELLKKQELAKNRQNHTVEVRNAGYDIRNSVTKMQTFYIEMSQSIEKVITRGTGKCTC